MITVTYAYFVVAAFFAAWTCFDLFSDMHMRDEIIDETNVTPIWLYIATPFLSIVIGFLWPMIVAEWFRE